MSNLLRCCVVSGVLFAAASPAAAQYRQWCFTETDRGGSGATSCIFYTYAQCREYSSGIGGICFQNPNIASSRSGGPDRRKPRSQYQD